MLCEENYCHCVSPTVQYLILKLNPCNTVFIHTLWNLCCQHKYHRQLLFLCPKLQTLCDIFCEKKERTKKVYNDSYQN